jgi:predicted nucleic acid-binding protein
MLMLADRPPVVLDACVLAPMPLCDTLLRCAESPALYRVAWSAETLREVVRTLMKFGYSARQAERRITAMQEAFPEACVSLSEQELAAAPEIPDPGDRHVVAAAIEVGAEDIVTFNERHFPWEVLRSLRIYAKSPNSFLCDQFHRDADRVLAALHAQASAIGESKTAILQRLKGALPDFVALVGGLHEKEDLQK